jgi:hypothetical protein
MAHKSKKKHLKHVHAHEPEAAAPPARKHAGAKAEVEAARTQRPRATAGTRSSGAERGTATSAKPTKKRGIVRSIARAARKKLTAKPKRVIKRVKSMLGV